MATPPRTETRTSAPAPVKWRARRPLASQEGTDKFTIPSEVVPDGMTWEFKRYSIMGQPDTTHMVAMERDGAWDPVTHEQWPERLGKFGEPGRPIIIDDMILMQRPESYTLEAKKEEIARASSQVANQFQSLGLSREGPPRAKPEVKRSYNQVQLVPDDDPADG